MITVWSSSRYLPPASVLDDYLKDNEYFRCGHGDFVERLEQDLVWPRFLAESRRPPLQGGGAHVLRQTEGSSKAWGFMTKWRLATTLSRSMRVKRAAFIDMAGNDAVTAQNPPSFWRPLRVQFGRRHDPLGFSEMARSPGELPGAERSMFFAPDQIQKRNREWGPIGLPAKNNE